MTTVRDILNLKELEEVKIIAGSHGVVAPVSSVTVLEVPDVSQWLNGGELIITSLYSIGDDASKQFNLINDMISHNCSGLVIKSSPYSSNVSPEIIKLADDNGFVLLALPHTMRYVDFIMPSMNLILSNKNMDEFREKFIHDLLFNANCSQSTLAEQGRILSIDLQNHHFQIINIYLDSKVADTMTNLEVQLRFILSSITSVIAPFYRINSCPWLIYGNNCTLLIEWSEFDSSELDLLINEILRLFAFYLKNASIKLAIGSVEDGLSGIRQSYKNASLAFETGSVTDNNSSIYDYEQTKLFCSICSHIKDNHNEFKSYIDLIDSKELTDTLLSYYTHNENIEETASFLFTHKNTVKYRLQKIADLTKLDYKNSHDNYILHTIALSILLQQ